MSIKNGCIGFHVAFVVPGDDAQRMEDFLKTHEGLEKMGCGRALPCEKALDAIP